MCDYETILAEQSATRYISQCEHGTVHLLWDGLGLHLNQERFFQMAAAIENAVSEMKQLVPQNGAGLFRLQVNHIFLGIPRQQFTQLWELVKQALPNVDLFAGIEDENSGRSLGRLHIRPARICPN